MFTAHFETRQEILQSPILLEHLDSMVIQHKERGSIDEFLYHFVLLSLKILEIGRPTLWLQNGNPNPWPQQGVLNLIERSHCMLETYTTHGKVRSTDILLLMQPMPCIRRFAAQTVDLVSQPTLDAITSHNLCPKLLWLWG